MSRNSEKRIPTNVIVGFLGSGKTTAIARLCEQRPAGEQWSVLINEFGVVSIDHALVESGQEEVAVEELGGGCACCTLSTVFQPLLTQFIQRTNPDRLIIEPSGVSHPVNVVDILRSPEFADVIDLRNIICVVDPQDAEDSHWRASDVFQDQLQLADIVVLNWTDNRDRELIDRCREWVESFRPPKQLILETSFGQIESSLLDRRFETIRFPLFTDAHPSPGRSHAPLNELDLASGTDHPIVQTGSNQKGDQLAQRSPTPGCPLRFQNDKPNFDACDWIFHVDDIFDRDELLDLLGYVHPIVRLKGVFRCEDDWWTINRAKEGTSYAPSAYRRDSRLEIILDNKTSGWNEFEAKLVDCLVR